MAHDVFISHSNQDKTVAHAMCSRLEQAGIRCWIAPRDVRPGRNWASEIIRGLDSAKVMIVVLSANANRSRSVRNEVERAFEREIVIIPVRTEEVEPSEALEFFLSADHWLDAITPPIEAHIDRLVHTVKEYLVEQGWTGAKGTGAPAEPPTAAAEPLPEENVGETRRPDLASSPLPSGVYEPSLAIPESSREEAAPIAEATEKTKGEDAPARQMEPPAQAIEDVAEAIQGPASRAKTGDANHGAPSRFAPLSAPVQADVGSAEDAQMEPPARKLPSEGAIPLPATEEKPPLWRTPKARRILGACAGLAIVAVLVVMWSKSPTEPRHATKGPPFVNSLGMRFVPVPGTNVLFSVWETRVKDYQAFCDGMGRSWEKPRFQQTDDHPAVNVSWEDGKAFCEWLSEFEGKRYRLPTDHEWSCAVGIGDQENANATPKSKDRRIADVFPWGKQWGKQWPPPDDAGNYFGEECKTSAGLAKLKAAGYGFLSESRMRYVAFPLMWRWIRNLRPKRAELRWSAT